MGYGISLMSGDGPQDIYGNAVHSRPSTSITSGLSRSSMMSGGGGGLPRGLKRSSSDVCYDQDGRQGVQLGTDCGADIVDDGFSPQPQKGSPPSNGKKTKGRVKIKMEYIDNKLRRYTTFSKRKTGIMKKVSCTLLGTDNGIGVGTGHRSSESPNPAVENLSRPPHFLVTRHLSRIYTLSNQSVGDSLPGLQCGCNNGKPQSVEGYPT
ncbi:hypothetical protein AAG570_011321 [Ranatra chinensis]|uniref:MADS-box domain-containing protein n=1 Tax=Ranatra chinensis TaxID=642074 RepID=A0ABD0Z6I7_9HEMI